MRHLIVTTAIVSAFATAPANADVTLQLSANVPSSCEILTVTPNLHFGSTTVEVQTACNIESFGLMISAGDNPVRLATATSPQAAVSGAGDGRLNVRLNRPGFQQFVLTLAEIPTDPVRIAVVPG